MYLLTKRIFDIISSTIALLLLSPFLLPITILLKLTSEGEVFYLQERIGINNKPFKIFKFATMVKNSSKMKGGHITLKNDPRLTFMGGFLRKSKINELPQLLNIFLGHMSVMGPRPVMRVSFESYPKKIQKVIYNVKPGLSGIGSIIFRDEEQIITKVKNDGGDIWDFYKNTIYPFKGSLELWYQKNKSFSLDLQLIFLTVWVILFPTSKLYEKWFNGLPKRNF
ncbi:MAG: lipid carrier--UDP-N-acetylgalactosaminyltransferase [Flavobacteriaceae bacterium]|nr:lipid carrier--UDP-N-acetylgalactosaminyltransferase [Flavobacteriaceae bacterium]